MTFSNLWKGFTDPETRVFQAADCEDLVIITCTFFANPPVWQTDRRTELRWLRRATAVAVLARKNTVVVHYMVRTIRYSAGRRVNLSTARRTRCFSIVVGGRSLLWCVRLATSESFSIEQWRSRIPDKRPLDIRPLGYNYNYLFDSLWKKLLTLKR